MFVAVYWWRVHPGKEEQFREAWRRGTEAITSLYGSYGSRLHQDRDGRFVGVAEWPDEAHWQKAFDARMAYDATEARAKWLDAIVETHRVPTFPRPCTPNLLHRGTQKRGATARRKT